MSHFEIAQLQRWLKRSEKQSTRRDIIIRYMQHQFNQMAFNWHQHRPEDVGLMSSRNYYVFDYVMDLPDHDIPDHPLGDTRHIIKDFEQLLQKWMDEDTDITFKEWLYNYKHTHDTVITFND